jgi:hypothetical protein
VGEALPFTKDHGKINNCGRTVFVFIIYVVIEVYSSTFM